LENKDATEQKSITLKKNPHYLFRKGIHLSQDPTQKTTTPTSAPNKLHLALATTDTTKITILFLTTGIASLLFSIYTQSNNLALIGLGLTFWGALFLFISRKRRVDSELLYKSALAEYSTIDRIISDLKYKGKGHHIPPYPKEVYLPEHLKGLKDITVFIPEEETFDFPSLEELAKGKFLLKKPKGILITPPGIGFIDQIENTLRTDFTKTNLKELTDILPRSILENLDLAEDLSMTTEGNKVKLRITNSIYTKLYSAQNKLQSVNIIGCPLASLVACILAKTTGKTVTIHTLKKSPDSLIIQIQYNIEEESTK
jgi:hypothetical protein